eukprot:1925262-Rhodomonas_salina.1
MHTRRVTVSVGVCHLAPVGPSRPAGRGGNMTPSSTVFFSLSAPRILLHDSTRDCAEGGKGV